MDQTVSPVPPPEGAGQTYRNHVRLNPLVHFFLLPVFVLNAVFALVALLREPGWDRAWALVVAIALGLLVGASRWQAVAVQDRLIRLEMWMRLSAVLPPELRVRMGELRVGQLIALRFAPDDELPELVRRALAGELRTRRQIKRAIRGWRGDYLRA